jgi:ADP-ribose pyrophosphatase
LDLLTVTFSSDDVQVESIATVYKGYFRIDQYLLRHRLFAGGWTGPVSREIFERGHAVGVLPYDPVRDRVVLIEQYRTGALAAGWQPWLVEMVAGIVEQGETPEEVARREMLEEAGATILDLVLINDVLVSPGGSSESMKIFCARVDSEDLGGFHGLAEEDEDIRVFTLSLDEALEWAKTGRICNAVGVLAIYWLALERKNLQARWGVGQS